MILTSKRLAEHPFAGGNTMQAVVVPGFILTPYEVATGLLTCAAAMAPAPAALLWMVRSSYRVPL